MKMTLAVEKTLLLTAGSQETVWTVSEADPDLEADIVAKYLGIEIQV